MPSLDKIKEFNRILTALGSEPEILSEKGEEIEEPLPPEQELSEDLKELLIQPAAEKRRPTPGAPSEAPTGDELEGEELDFESLFGDQQEALEGLDELPMDFQDTAREAASETIQEPPIEEIGEEEAHPPEAPPSEPSAEELIEPSLGEVPIEEGEEPLLEAPELEVPEPGAPSPEPEAAEGIETFAGPEEIEAALAGLEEAEAERPAEEAPEEAISAEGLEFESEEAAEEEPPSEEPAEEAFPEAEALLGEDGFPDELPPLEMEEAGVEEEAVAEPSIEISPEELEEPAFSPEVPAPEGEAIQPTEEPQLPEEPELPSFDEIPEVMPSLEAEEEEFAEAPGAEAAGMEMPGVETPGIEMPEEISLPTGEEPFEAPAEEPLEAGIELGPEEGEGEDFQIEEFALPPVDEDLAAEERLAPGMPEVPEGIPEEEFPEEEFPEVAAEIEEGEGAGLEIPSLEMPGMEMPGMEMPEPGFAEAEFPPSAEAGIPPQQAEAAGIEMEEAVSAEDVHKREFSPAEVQAIQNTLISLPLNLKIAVEELLGSDTLTPQDSSKLLNMLIRAGSPREIAAFASKLAGRTIELPSRFEKTTGIEFELERRTFAYNFRQNILPILKVFIPTLILAVLIGLAVNQFIVIPIRANNVYRDGYELIDQELYQDANDRFATATGILPVKRWFFRYAEKYTGKEQYLEAADKYEELLKRYGLDRQATLDYARLESQYRAGYAKAEQLLNALLAKDISDYDALLASGDNYMEWAKVDEKYHKNAYAAYTRILSAGYAARDEPWFRLLRFFMRTDQVESVEELKNRFMAQNKVDVDPEIYAELGGYLIEHDRLEDVKEILNEALEVNPEIPEIYYHFSRYFQAVGDPFKEEEALQYTRMLLEQLEKHGSLTTSRVTTQILTYNRLGEIYASQDQPAKADAEYQNAIKLIEEYQDAGILPKAAEYGKVYYNRGDVFYYNLEPNLSKSQAMYEKAMDNLYDAPEMRFKTGYIAYVRQDYYTALKELYSIRGDLSTNQNYLFSLANTLYQRGDFFAAQGFYRRLIDILEEKKNRIPIIRPEEIPEHLALIELLMKTHNNLGVTLVKLSESPLDPEKETEALVNFVQSTEYFDVTARDPETLARGESRSLSDLNARQVQYPQPNYIVQIYNRIPKDPTVNRF